MKPPTTRTDRRIERSKRLLRQAMLDLVFEKHYDDISVQDVLDRADVGRSTFYTHFRNKDELFLGDLPRVQWLGDPEGRTVLPSVVALFEHFSQNYELFRAIAGSSAVDLMLHKLKTAFIDDWTERIASSDPRVARIEAELQARFAAGALIELAIWWLQAGMPIPARELGELFDSMTTSALSGVSEENT